MAWHAVAAMAVLLLPSLVLRRTAFTRLPLEDQVQGWVAVAAYLGAALAASRLASPRHPAARLALAALVTVAAFAAFATAARVLGAAPVSRLLMATSAALGLAAVAATWLPSALGRGAALGGLAGLTLVAARAPERLVPPARHLVREVAGAGHVLRVDEWRGLIPGVPTLGGAITRWGDAFLLVTADGDFHRVSLAGPDGPPVVEPLPLHLRFGREALRADSAAAFGATGGAFVVRANDVLVEATGARPRVLVTHNQWHARERCLTIRVSATALPAPGDAESPATWTTLYESSPCVPPTPEIRRGGLGSRLAWDSTGALLLTVGDHGLAGPDGAEGPQDTTSSYGKVVRIDRTGAARLLTRGHRNPQGLVVTRAGRAWSTEHGPQGGDEVNALADGGNFGWPLATYGVQYGQDRWPLARERTHGTFREPALAFVPSVGISNLIELGPAGLPRWEGDLLVASLKGETLFRLRTRDDRVVYQERLPVGVRVRDLEQAADGRVLLLGDQHVLLVLTPRAARSEGAVAYAPCAECHGPALEGTPQGPSLRGIVGRPVAAQPGFAYSPALRAHGGTWTPARLLRFLANPAGTVPGTRMAFEGLEGRALTLVLDYLRSAP